MVILAFPLLKPLDGAMSREIQAASTVPSGVSG
jgi:hypothetical protein